MRRPTVESAISVYNAMNFASMLALRHHLTSPAGQAVYASRRTAASTRIMMHIPLATVSEAAGKQDQFTSRTSDVVYRPATPEDMDATVALSQ